MAKVLAVLFVLALIGGWAFVMYDATYQGTPGPPIETIAGNLFPSGAVMRHDTGVPMFAMFVTALFGLLAFAFALLYMTFRGSGSIFSVSLTSFVTLYAAAANMLVGLWLIGKAIYEPTVMNVREYGIADYAVGIYALVTTIASLVVIRNVDGLLRGKSDARTAIIKSLLVLIVVAVPLGPIRFLPGFEVSSTPAVYWLAGLCVLSLMFIGLTRSNYRYD
jgi:hypothetical protein